MKGTIVVSGSLAQRPHHGGHTWVFLQYLLGFRREGWDVLFLDRLDPDMCVDRHGAPAPVQHSLNLAYLREVMDAFGLGDRWALFGGDGDVFGLDRDAVVDQARRSALVLDVMGFLADEDVLAAAPLRVFFDIDPGFGQMWADLGLHVPYDDFDDFVTIGENIGQPSCRIPTCGIDWITTKQPVVLDEWPVATEQSTRFTSVGSWRGPYGPIDYDGDTYGLRVHEFRRLAGLPTRVAGRFEIALDIDDVDGADRQLLLQNGWDIVDPRVVARDPWTYRQYVSESAAEFMVAKHLYVATHSGWFSDRSACYLASGRPVLAQDTGLANLVPAGEGLVLFDTLDGAVAGAEDIVARYDHHATAAREVAAALFSSDVVLPALLAKLGVH